MVGESAGGSNREVAGLLRDVAVALRIKGADRFQAAAYESAASGVLHTTAPVRELWRAGRLTDIPGIGGTIAGHLDEWFRTGHAARFDEALDGIPDVVLELVRIPGVGPATAQKLAAAGVEDMDDLERRLERGDLASAGLGAKMLERIAQGLGELTRRPDRMLLPVALAAAAPLVHYLRAAPFVERAEALGSARRRCATVADIDLGVAAHDLTAVVAHLRSFPGAEVVAPKPLPGAQAWSDMLQSVSVALHNGRQVDVLVGTPERYGALRQWLTGSAAHNETFARRATERGLTLGPDGVRDSAGRLIATPEEEDVYRLLGLPAPPPELREGTGEVEAAAAGTLPRLVTAEDVRGDCHSHTSWSDGRDGAARMIEAARALRRE